MRKTILIVTAAFWSAASILAANANSNGAGQSKRTDADIAIAMEAEIVAAIRDRARIDADAEVSQKLKPQGNNSVFGGQNAWLALRAAAVCAALNNVSEPQRAQKLARNAVAQLAKGSEPNDADRVTRLYWEAWMHGEVLDDPQQAVELMKAAAKIAPNDARVVAGTQRWGHAAERKSKK